MRKAGLALQSPFRCVSGCFSSHSEFKSHLIPAPPLPPASAALQSGAVCGGPEGAQPEGPCPQGTCQPRTRARGGPALQHPPALRVCSPRVFGAAQESVAGQGCLWGTRQRGFLQTLSVPLVSSALLWGVGSLLSQGPVTSWSFASPFYIPTFLNFLFSPAALCGAAGDNTRGGW